MNVTTDGNKAAVLFGDASNQTGSWTKTDAGLTCSTNSPSDKCAPLTYGFAATSGATTPEAFSTLAATLKVSAVIRSQIVNSGAQLDGNTTISLSYI